MSAKAKLTKPELLLLSGIAREGRLVVKIIGSTPRAAGLPAWANDEFALARALVAKGLQSYTEADKRKKRELKGE